MPRPRIRVLIAEDHRDTRDGYCAYLKRAGMDVRTVADGEKALRTARRWRPHVAVLDLSMPRLTGDEVARELRKERAGTIAIVILSGYADFGQRRALEAGADEYWPKPCLPHELATIVQRLAPAELGPEPDEPSEQSA